MYTTGSPTGTAPATAAGSTEAATAPGTPWPLVGRDPYVRAFTRDLADPDRDGFLVLGPAGAGCSRLARECLARAARAGHATLAVRATTAGADVPFGAVAHLLPPDARALPPAALHAEAGRGLDRRRAGRPGRQVLFVDDLHHLDPDSALLVRRLMDDQQVFLLATARSAPPGGRPPTAVATLTDEDRVRRVDLPLLDRARTALLLERTLGLPVTDRTLGLLFALSDGNPLYLRELVRGALAGGALTGDGRIWDLDAAEVPLTPYLVDRVHDEVRPYDASPVLEALAVCGPLPLHHLLDLAGPRAVDALERAALIAVRTDGRRRDVGLVLPLHARVLREGLTEVRRRDLLLRSAALTERSGARREGDPGLIAVRLLEATGHGHPEPLDPETVRASDTADPGRARRLLEAVPEGQHGVAALLLLAEARYRAGECAAAERTLARAAALARTEEDTLLVLGARVHNLVHGLGSPPAVCRAVIEAARPRVRGEAGVRELALAEAVVAQGTGDGARALELTAPLVPVGGPHEAPTDSVRLRACLVRSLALGTLGRGEEAVEWARAAVDAPVPHEAAVYTGLVMEAAKQRVLVQALVTAGRLPEARAYGRPAHEARSAVRDHESRRLVLALGRAELAAGRLDRARRLFADAAHASRRQRTGVFAQASGLLAVAAAQQGDLATAAAAVAEGRAAAGRPDGDAPPTAGPSDDAEHVDVPELLLGEAWRYACGGELGRAREQLRRGAAEALRLGRRGRESLFLTDLVRLGDAAWAAPRLAALAEAVPEPAHLLRAGFAGAWAARDAARLLAAAVELEDRGALLLAAECRSTAAAALRQGGRERQARAAEREVHALVERCGGARTPVLQILGAHRGLTLRETEISLLAARGLTDKAIGRLLHLSHRTVENHLHRVYGKLGVAGRRELAARLLRATAPVAGEG
ncbi:LuxR C-terminal-related transcriptional regulator [Streptomyces sp. NPDC057939]|uniref:LuxR C-terminal-related transcriptional regulator n=1 Tax=Streptomyces sp. NPDC057939 TaxID=3346284 RepID=UPI0036E07990